MNKIRIIVPFLILSSLLLMAQTPELTSSNLPLVIVNTHGQEIQDLERIVADMGIIFNPGQRNNITDDYNNYNGRIAIETRGSSSSAYPKKQYRLETQDSSGNNFNVSLLGLPKENDWVLYGPYDDQSLIRNVLAYKISNKMGRYASRTHFCELILNDTYQGLYVLLETIKRDKNRVDIATLNEQDISGDQLTGGYIIKIDKIEGESTERWNSPYGTLYQYHYPKYDDIQPEQINYIQNYIAAFEDLMNSSDYNDPGNGYTQYIDEDSFADHFIINEFAKNVDAYRLSAFLYKDKDSNNGKLKAGPVWDFNLSFGKAWFSEDLYRTQGWQVNYNSWRPFDSFKVPFWWEKLARDYHFESKVTSRWQELRQNILSTEKVFASIDSLVDEIAEARQRNFAKWPASAPEHSYEQEILQLKSWIIARTEWIDKNISLLTSVQPDDQKPQKIFLSQNYPNPFNASTTITFYLTQADHVELNVYNLLGKEVAVIVNQYLANGLYTYTFEASSLSSGVYVYQLKTTSGLIRAKKFLLIK